MAKSAVVIRVSWQFKHHIVHLTVPGANGVFVCLLYLKIRSEFNLTSDTSFNERPLIKIQSENTSVGGSR